MTSKLFPYSQLNVNVSLFSGVAGEKIGDFPLVDLISTMQLEWSAKIYEIREEPDKEKQKAMKKKLPCFTPSALCSVGHRQEHIISHSGFLCLDIDLDHNTSVPGFNTLIPRIAKYMPWCAYCGRSVRGKGFFLLIRIKHPEKHSAYWNCFHKWFNEKHQIELDSTKKNPNDLRFVSYDYDAHWNHTPEEFDYILPTPTHTRPTTRNKKHQRFKTGSNDKVIQLCKEIERRGIDITTDYEDWYKVGFSFASLGEQGRVFYHVCSRQYPGYRYEETDKKFTNLLQHSDGRMTIASFFDICKKYGVGL